MQTCNIYKFKNRSLCHILNQMSILFLQKLMNNSLIVLYCLLVMFLPTTVFGAGGEPDHQLPSVSGAACRGREAGGPLRGNMCQGLPIGQRRRRAAEASRGSSWHGEPGPQRPAAACPPLRQLRRANRTLRPGHGHDHERDGKHFHFHGWCWWVQKEVLKARGNVVTDAFN